MAVLEAIYESHVAAYIGYNGLQWLCHMADRKKTQPKASGNCNRSSRNYDMVIVHDSLLFEWYNLHTSDY